MPQLSLSLRIGGFALVAIAISLAAFLDADAQSPPPTVELEIAMDADASGNTGSSVGALDSCRVVSVGETFDLDIVLPEVPPPGFWGLGADIVYDPAVLQVMAFDYDLLLAQNQPFIPWDANNTTPDTDGDFRVDFVDLSGGPGETGPGAIGRVTFRAVGGGGTVVDLTDTLDVGGVLLISGAGEQYAISDVRDAEIVVGGSCPGLLSDSDGDNFKDAR